MADFRPCLFAFSQQDIRIEGQSTSGGTSLSGIDEPIRTDGGGFIVADFTGGSLIDRDAVLAWRAITASLDGGAIGVDVYFSDRRHQPVGRKSGPGQPGAVATSTNSRPLRATTLNLAITSEKPVKAGMWFSILHATWGSRAYLISDISGSTVTFRPPLREAISAATALDFDDPHCRMRLAAATSNAMSGRLGSAGIRFVEDMRKP